MKEHTPDITALESQIAALQEKQKGMIEKDFVEGLIAHGNSISNALKLRAEAAEAELARRDAAAREAVAVVDIQRGREDGRKFALCYTSAGHSLPDDVYNLYAAAQPSALPPDIEPLLEDALKMHGLRTADIGHSQLSDGFRNGARWATKALGCKAIKLPGPCMAVIQGGHAVMVPYAGGHWLNKTAVIEAIAEQGFTVEGE